MDNNTWQFEFNVTCAIIVLAFFFGFIFARVCETEGLFPHLDVFIQWIRWHTTQRTIVAELEFFLQSTGLPVQLHSASWPGLVNVGMWAFTLSRVVRGRR